MQNSLMTMLSNNDKRLQPVDDIRRLLHFSENLR